MKKVIPYIFITAFIGAFLGLSFYPSFSGITLWPKVAEAQMTQDQTQTPETPQKNGVWTWIKDNFGLRAWVATGKDYLEHPQHIIPGQLPIQKGMDAVGDWGAEKITDATIGRLMALISDFTWLLSVRIFNMSAYLLDNAVDFSVKDFKKNIENIGVIDQGYKIILNIANMIFIFILLYIAIQTILGLSGSDIKKLLTHVIVVALFINFSLFMTKVIIDASNIVAMGFYNAVRTEVGETQPEAGKKPEAMVSVGSISTVMMAGLRLQSQMPSPDSTYNKADPYKGLTNFNIAMNQFGGSALFLVSAFAFFSAAFLFITRFIALLFYMLFSPIAFLGILAPEMFREYSSKWWGGLQSQAIFAPVFLFMVYLISSIINSGQLWAVVGGSSNPSANYYDAFSSSGQGGSFPIIMNYVILIALMIGGLIASKAMAAKGSSVLVGYADKVRGWAQGVAGRGGSGLGRNIIGRGAYLASNTNYMKDLESKHPWLGGLARTQIENVAGASFGGTKGGYTKALEEKVKRQVARSKQFEYEGEDTKRMDKEIKEEERKQEQRVDARLDLKKKARDAKKTYESKVEEKEKDLKDLKSEVEKIEKGLETSGHYLNPAEEARHEEAKKEIGAINLEIKNTKSAYTTAQDKYEEMGEEIERSERKIKDAKKNLEKVKNKYKTKYTENLPFEHWGANWRVWDKVFPSYTRAVKQIRKGEKTVQELLDEARKKTGEIKEGEGEKKEEKKE